MSNYPPGFGSASDLDHVEGPLTEEELAEPCPLCTKTDLVRETFRAAPARVACWSCDYERDEEDERD